MSLTEIAVLASGRGSNFEAIYRAIQDKTLSAKIMAVISDQPQSLILEKAQSFGIPTYCVPFPEKKAGRSIEDRRLENETNLMKVLGKVQPKFLVMAGYMRIVTSHLIDAFRCDKGYSRMVNIHPSLLPAFPGANAYAQAFRFGAKVTGVTVHLVDIDVDSGPICAQEAFSIEDCHSVQEVEQRGLAVEHRLFPQTLSWVLEEKFTLVPRFEGRFCVCPN
jgi:phosphoribosylglycinamide formyltransferase-1